MLNSYAIRTRYYPKTGALRYWINQYNLSKEWDEEVRCVNVYETWLSYGGPEEGGWWYEEGNPEACHHVFSKKQAIKRAIELSQEYDLANQPDIHDVLTQTAIDIRFSEQTATAYPSSRPHYE